MAIVDNAFREWIADFKATNPGVADSRAILDTAQYAFAAGRKAQREIDAARQPVGEPVELACVAETLANGAGLWMTCSGCHESNEGAPTGQYSTIMQCHLGHGCDECGGIGAIWDTTDYQQMADEMAKSLAAPPAQAVDLGAVRALLERRIAQWRSHLPTDPGAPGTREIETKGEHDYNNDVRIYREGIAVMQEVLALTDSQAVGNG
ncbi:hypothetical protein [Stenotrophomonas maltophilia]|uniref:hypothetical protein n=1 Tax=Stenotrophomonas maltophilia TaxID=40324 RepID=UPI002E78F6CD|nr:hypothetical protein [Stenotrophomonas maltophilia]